jgi:hypothetical protein
MRGHLGAGKSTKLRPNPCGGPSRVKNSRKKRGRKKYMKYLS